MDGCSQWWHAASIATVGRTVIIGGSGFIGCRLIPELSQLGPVLNLDRVQSAGAPLAKIIDVRDRSSFAGLFESRDTIVLLAAEHRDDVTPTSLYYEVNVEGTRSVLAEMDSREVRRIVFTSTVAVYGLDKARPPKESDVPDPFNHYGRSKRMAEELLQEWVRRGEGRSALVLRPTVVFGEGNRGNVFNLLNQICSGRFIMIGGGENRKSMSYVGNLVAFIRFMVERGWTGLEVINYADTPDLDMNAIVNCAYQFKGGPLPGLRLPYAVGICAGAIFDAASAVTGLKFPISSIRVRKFCSNTQVDASKLDTLGFQRPYSLADGLQRMLVSEFSNRAKSAS
jgi:GlcNAc-P-P-Und epimerase